MSEIENDTKVIYILNFELGGFETQLLSIQLWYCLKENVRANLASKMKNTYLKHLK